MKRIVVLIASVFLILGILSACSDSASTSSKNNDKKDQQELKAATITPDQYNQIKLGMPYKTVVSIIGGKGTLIKGDHKMYIYKGKDNPKANAVFTFKDGKLIEKVQTNLISKDNKKDTASKSKKETDSKSTTQKQKSDENVNKTNKNKSTAAIPKGLIPVTVSKNVDGDTIHVNMNGKDEQIRMLLIDTPEEYDPRKPVEPYAKEAAAYAEQKLPVGKKIYIKEGIEKRDKYNRLLAYVFITPNDMYNKDVVQEGLARVGYVYNDTTYLSKLKTAQADAKANERKIWSIPGYVDAEHDGYNLKIACKWAADHGESTRGCQDYNSSSNKNVNQKQNAAPSVGVHPSTSKPSVNAGSNTNSDSSASKQPSSSTDSNSEAPKNNSGAVKQPENPSSGQTDFANCTELRKVYPNGVPSSSPAYQPKMDRDHDNFACERN